MKKVLSILLVEDNMIEIMKIRRTITLLDLNHKVIEAKNAEKALSLLESKAIFPDIILLDLNMPKFSGIDFLSILPLEKVFDATENQWREMIGR